MRGTVAKKLRAEAREIAADQPTKKGIKKFMRFFKDKVDEKGKPIKFIRETIVYAGYRRIYQDLKKQRRILCKQTQRKN